MATLAMFRSQFPEMNNVSDVLVATMLAAAFLEIDVSVWGAYGLTEAPMTKTDQAQMYLAAHKLAVSPFGQNAKTVFDPKRTGYARTTYGAEYLLLQRSVTSGFRVA